MATSRLPSQDSMQAMIRNAFMQITLKTTLQNTRTTITQNLCTLSGRVRLAPYNQTDEFCARSLLGLGIGCARSQPIPKPRIQIHHHSHAWPHSHPTPNTQSRPTFQHARHHWNPEHGRHSCSAHPSAAQHSPTALRSLHCHAVPAPIGNESS